MPVEQRSLELKTSEHQDTLESQIARFVARFGFWFLINAVDLPQIYRLYGENLRQLDLNQSFFYKV